MKWIHRIIPKVWVHEKVHKRDVQYITLNILLIYYWSHLICDAFSAQFNQASSDRINCKKYTPFNMLTSIVHLILCYYPPPKLLCSLVESFFWTKYNPFSLINTLPGKDTRFQGRIQKCSCTNQMPEFLYPSLLEIGGGAWRRGSDKG